LGREQNMFVPSQFFDIKPCAHVLLQWIRAPACGLTISADQRPQEIALRCAAAKKSKVEGVRSTPYMPLQDAIGLVAVTNEVSSPVLQQNEIPPDSMLGLPHKKVGVEKTRPATSAYN
jgi:hypothetical protein